MNEIHCHTCGGFITNPAAVSHRVASAVTVTAEPRSGLCSCTQAIVYGAPAGYVSWPGLGSMVRTIATRN